MPSPINMKAKSVDTPVIKAKEYNISYEELNEDDFQTGGYKVGFIGKATTMKTIMAVGLGHLQKKNIPDMLEMGLKLTPKALERDLIPEINKIIMVDSEGTFKDQRTRPIEKTLFEGLPKIFYKKVPIVSKDIDINPNISSLKEETIIEINNACDTFTAYIDDIAGKYNVEKGTFEGGKCDRNTLVVIDSASRYKLYLDMKSDLDVSLRLNGVTDAEKIKEIIKSKWINRNMWWMRFFSVLRTIPAWTGVTFMIDYTSPWVVKMMREKGKPIEEDREVIGEKTEFCFDNIYQLNKHVDTKVVTTEQWSARYELRGADAEALGKFEMKTSGKFAKYNSLLFVEAMLKAMEQSGVVF